MAVDHIRYDILVQEALREMVRRVLADVAKKGVPGEHHFYIDFDTRAPGVKISSRLREQYPEAMRIVLQHQFWDLIVTDHGFEVGLSFHGVPERLVVPFEAVQGFFDPSVQFGLQFEVGADKRPAAEAETTAPKAASAAANKAKPERPARREPARKLPAVAPEPAALPAKAEASANDPDEKPTRPPGGGEVVRLDRFRKK